MPSPFSVHPSDRREKTREKGLLEADRLRKHPSSNRSVPSVILSGIRTSKMGQTVPSVVWWRWEVRVTPRILLFVFITGCGCTGWFIEHSGPDADTVRDDGDVDSPDDLCDGVSCSDHGSCLTDGEQAICVCDDGYLPEGRECVPSGTDGDADSDADIDSDIDSDIDADIDADFDECPENTAWPCTCTLEGGGCLWGQDCLGVSGEDNGFCSIECDGHEDTTTCVLESYGVESEGGGICAVTAGAGGQMYCIVVCRISGESGPCPPGLACVPSPSEGVWVCQ